MMMVQSFQMNEQLSGQTNRCKELASEKADRINGRASQRISNQQSRCKSFTQIDFGRFKREN